MKESINKMNESKMSRYFVCDTLSVLILLCESVKISTSPCAKLTNKLQHISVFYRWTNKWLTSSLLSSSDSWCDDDATDFSLALSTLAIVCDLWVRAELLGLICKIYIQWMFREDLTTGRHSKILLCIL